MNVIAENAAYEYLKDDNSFKDTSFFGSCTKFKQKEVREIYERAIKSGIEIGMRVAPVRGCTINLTNPHDEKGKKFLEEYHKLAEKYNCDISWHDEIGMLVRRHPYRDNPKKTATIEVENVIESKNGILYEITFNTKDK